MEAAQKFAVLKAAGRYWAVGAVHGEAGRLQNLHHKLAGKLRDGDKLVYLGNFIGRGEAVIETIDELLRFRRDFLARPRSHIKDFVMLRGGQEEIWQKLQQIHLAMDPSAVLEWMLREGVAPTIAAYGGRAEEGASAIREGTMALNRWTSGLRQAVHDHDGHTPLMSSLRRAAYSDDGGLLFVHAGLDPTRPIDGQADSFWWRSSGFDAIDAPYGTFRRIVRGYDRRHAGVKINPFTATVDGGCGFGGSLVAACFDTVGNMVDLIEA